MSDPNRMKFHGEEFYVKSIEEMGRIFPDHPRRSRTPSRSSRASRTSA
jgi:DNA polymerase III alpha subunit